MAAHADGAMAERDNRAALCSLAMAAAQAGNCKALLQCLDAGAHPDGVRDTMGDTPLLSAARRGHAECVMALVRAGADLSITNTNGEGALHICFAAGHTSLGTTISAISSSSSCGIKRDWVEYAEDHGVDTEAIMAAIELGLDLNMFEPHKVPVRGDGDDMLSLPGTTHTVKADIREKRKRPPVPTLELPVATIDTEAEMLANERALAQAALDARDAEAEMYEAAATALGHQHAGAGRKKRREKIRNRHQGKDIGQHSSAPVKQAGHVSESIMLMGKTQAAYELCNAKMTQAQLEAAELDREIQEQLDDGLLAAARDGDAKGIQSWLDKGAMIEVQEQATCSSVLHLAAAVGNKRACKAALRAGVELDLLDVDGRVASEVAFVNGHDELGAYLRTKTDYVLGDEQRRITRDQKDVSHGKQAGERLANTDETLARDVVLEAMRTVQGDVKGLEKQIRQLDMTTYPICMDGDAGGYTGRSSQDSEEILYSCSVEADYDDLTCAEEFVQSVSPVTGKDSFTDLDLLLEEADRALLGEEEQAQQLEQEGEGESDEEFDALARMGRILEKHPVPPSTTLYKISTAEDKAERFMRRGSELQKIRRTRKAAARPRILNGVALLIANMPAPEESGLSTNEQFTSDLIQLEKVLPSLGFSYIDIKRNITRGQVMDGIFETCASLCPGGNLEDADGFLVLVLSTGGPTSFDCKPLSSANEVAHGACCVGFQEVVNLIRVVPGIPKVTLFNICGDPEERKKANFDVPLRPMPCVPNLYQKMLDDCQDVLMVLIVTSGKVNWVPRAGSLSLRFLLEELAEEGANKDLAEIVIGLRERLLEYFYSRRGTGKPQCPVGRGEYDKFFLQTPLFTEGTSDCKLMLGPGIRFAKSLWGADFLSQPGFFFQRVNTRVCKDKATESYVHAYGNAMPRTCEGLNIDLEKGTPNLAWEIVLVEMAGSEEVHIGAALPPTAEIQRAPSFSKAASAVSRVSSAVNAFTKVSSTASNGSSGSGKLRRAASIQRAGSSAIQRTPSINRTRSMGSDSGAVLDLNMVAVVGKAPNTFGISSDGRVNPDVEGTDNFGGMKAGSIIRVWHNRADRELEFTVDGRHIQKVWKQANLGQLLVPAISIGPSTTCTLDITNFWSW